VRTDVLNTALVLTSAIGLAGTASALTVVPAQYVAGIVQAVDHRAGTLTVANGTYQVRNHGELDEVNPGDKVDVAFVTENGQRIAIAVTLD